MFKSATSLIVGCLFLLGINQVAEAQSEFNIRVFGGVDTEKPTTPNLLSADPVASSQIDLDWTPSTDNFSVAGYVINRDGDYIATTSLDSFSDIGLTPSTTYSYFIRAFDGSANYSSSSNIIATTTPEVFVPSPDPDRTTLGTIGRVVLDNLDVSVGISTSSINLNTVLPARTEIRWGRTNTYEVGYIVGSVFKREHVFNLTNLEPDTSYSYEIVGFTPSGAETILVTDSFTTLSNEARLPPANVSRLRAEVNGSNVLLDWENPTSEFAYVRIVRSHLGFPTHPNDGAVAYQGRGESVNDESILDQYSPVYYTAFVYGEDGRLSSGAVVFVVDSRDDELSTSTPTRPAPISEPSSDINEERMTPEMRMPDLSDFSVIQGGKKFTLLDNDIELNSADDFVVVLPIEMVSGNLKSIILTVLDPTDNRQAYSFLMRINNDRTAYVATVSPLNVLGSSQLQIEVFDYQVFVVGTYQSPVEFVVSEEINWLTEDRDLETFIVRTLLAIALVFSLLLAWLLIYRLRTEDKI
jgi:hypothetical protein